MVILRRGGYVIVVVSLVLQVVFLSQTLKTVLMGYSRNAARCKWGKLAVMVWAGGGSNLRVRVTSYQRKNTNQGRVGPNWNVNIPAHIMEPPVVRIPCCTKPLSKVALLAQNS